MKQGRYGDFWSHVDICDPDHCWEFLGARNWKGYGKSSIRGRETNAHRVAFELHYGYKPIGFVCHRCDNPPCCNPRHLFEGSKSDNMRDCVLKGRHGSQIRPGIMPKGEGHYRSKLTDRKVQTMRAFYSIGLFNQSELARIYGITQASVWRIVMGRSWKHLQIPGPIA